MDSTGISNQPAVGAMQEPKRGVHREPSITPDDLKIVMRDMVRKSRNSSSTELGKNGRAAHGSSNLSFGLSLDFDDLFEEERDQCMSHMTPEEASAEKGERIEKSPKGVDQEFDPFAQIEKAQDSFHIPRWQADDDDPFGHSVNGDLTGGKAPQASTDRSTDSDEISEFVVPKKKSIFEQKLQSLKESTEMSEANEDEVDYGYGDGNGIASPSPKTPVASPNRRSSSNQLPSSSNSSRSQISDPFSPTKKSGYQMQRLQTRARRASISHVAETETEDLPFMAPFAVSNISPTSEHRRRTIMSKVSSHSGADSSDDGKGSTASIDRPSRLMCRRSSTSNLSLSSHSESSGIVQRHAFRRGRRASVTGIATSLHNEVSEDTAMMAAMAKGQAAAAATTAAHKKGVRDQQRRTVQTSLVASYVMAPQTATPVLSPRRLRRTSIGHVSSMQDQPSPSAYASPTRNRRRCSIGASGELISSPTRTRMREKRRATPSSSKRRVDEGTVRQLLKDTLAKQKAKKSLENTAKDTADKEEQHEKLQSLEAGEPDEQSQHSEEEQLVELVEDEHDEEDHKKTELEGDEPDEPDQDGIKIYLDLPAGMILPGEEDGDESDSDGSVSKMDDDDDTSVSGSSVSSRWEDDAPQDFVPKPLLRHNTSDSGDAFEEMAAIKKALDEEAQGLPTTVTKVVEKDNDAEIAAVMDLLKEKGEEDDAKARKRAKKAAKKAKKEKKAAKKAKKEKKLKNKKEIKSKSKSKDDLVADATQEGNDNQSAMNASEASLFTVTSDLQESGSLPPSMLDSHATFDTAVTDGQKKKHKKKKDKKDKKKKEKKGNTEKEENPVASDEDCGLSKKVDELADEIAPNADVKESTTENTAALAEHTNVTLQEESPQQ
jgi:hypothetical protein